MSHRLTLTTNFGQPVADNQNGLTAGLRGLALMPDIHPVEKLTHFNRERVPERVVHAKGSGAYGTFRVTGDITRSTKAKLFNQCDGSMRFDGNSGAAPNYAPNTQAEAPQYRDPAWVLGDTTVDRYTHHGEEDHYTQSGDLFRLMTSAQQQLLINNISASMNRVTRAEIVRRQLGHWKRVDEKLAAGIAKKLEVSGY